jgi:hypothetical protein
MAALNALHRDRILLKPVCQSYHFARKRRGDQVRPPGLRRVPEDSVQLFLEVHVEHFVGFVQRDGLQLLERHGAGAQMIEKAARGADDDLGKPL